MAFSLIQRFRKNPSFDARLSELCREAQDAGARDGVAGTPFAEYPDTKRVEIEQCAHVHVQGQLGKAPALPPLRSASRTADESHREAQRNLEQAQLRPLGIHRRILLSLGGALLALGASLAMRLDLLAAGTCAAGMGLLMGFFAEAVRLWWKEHGVERARRREQARRAELEAAEDHVQAFAEQVASLVELGRAQLALAYQRGCGKGARYLEVNQQRRSAGSTSVGAVPESAAESDVRDTLPDIEPWALQYEPRPTNGAGRGRVEREPVDTSIEAAE